MTIVDVQKIPSQFNVAIIVSRFHGDLTQKMLDGALLRFAEKGFSEDRITVLRVPGAVEIPLTAQRLARTGKYEGIICLGVVIKGETYHFEYVCEQVSQGCQKVALDHDLPVIFGVLTTENLQQALSRAGGDRGNIGSECVDAVVDLISVLSQV